MTATPFRIDVAQPVLDDLRSRLSATRWPDAVDGAGWDYGTNREYLQALVRYWQHDFDWRAQEAKLNGLAQFRAEVDGIGLHFVHERGKSANPLPIVLSHGWPDSFWRFTKLIPLLTADVDGFSFDVVVPSIPGYAFSDKPAEKGALFKVNDQFARLMTDTLGYAKFAAHGGDWGSTITEHLARHHASELVGIHLTDVPFWHAMQPPADLSLAEKRFIQKSQEWKEKEGSYSAQQGTKPQTLGYGVNDSPAGLAAWIVEKFRTWSDCGGDVETRFSKDELLTNLTLYWVTETINSSFRLYYDAMHQGVIGWVGEKFAQYAGPPKVPAALASFPKDIRPPPREWAERFFDLQRFTEMSKGGHFAAFEEPELLAEDLRAFFKPLWAASRR